MISDAAKQVKVESHVLRYWEEELHLPIKRNELGHRYYTKEDVERFKEIKSMKERGLQLKAIKMILKDGRLDVLPEEREKEPVEARKEPAEVRTPHMAIEIVDKPWIKRCRYSRRRGYVRCRRRKDCRVKAGKRRLKGSSGSCNS